MFSTESFFSRAAASRAFLFLLGISSIAAPLAVAPAHAQTGSTAAKDAATLLTESMWAAQLEPRGIRLSWDNVADGARYVLSCELGKRPLRVLGNIGPLIGTKLLSGAPRRVGYVAPIDEPGLPHRCYLQLAVDSKSALSARIPFNEVVPIVPAPLTRPPATTLVATATAVGEITLRWDEAPGATAYSVGRSIAPDGFRAICDICRVQTTFIDRTAKPGARHRYTVTPLSPAGALSRATSNDVVAPKTSDEIVAAADPDVSTDLRAPGGVNATVTGPASVTVTWQPVPNAAGYEIYRATNGGGLQLLARVPGSAVPRIEYSDYLGSLLTASNSLTAKYAVKSVGANGAATEPKESNEVTIESKATVSTGTTSTSVSNARATATSATSVTLTWSPPAGAVTCSILRSLDGGPYLTLTALTSGTSQYVDTATSLMTLRPRYRIACGSAKSAVTTVAFPDPRWNP